MTKIYQILNDQYQEIPGGYFGSLNEAKARIGELHKTYSEAFYVIELQVVYTSPPSGVNQ